MKRVIDALPPVLAHRLLALGHWTLGRAFRLLPLRKISCFAVIGNRGGEVLLVRQTYRRDGEWTVPAGYMRRSEDPVEAARREVSEEVGCAIEDASFDGYYLWRGDDHWLQGYIISATTRDTPTPDGVEVAEARFFALDALPEELYDFARWIIDELRARDGYAVPVPPFVRPDFVGRRPERYRRGPH